MSPISLKEWKCHVCGRIFDSEKDLIEHIDKEHPHARPIEDQFEGIEPKVFPKDMKDFPPACKCPKCGYILVGPDKSCPEIKCPKCGGEMRVFKPKEGTKGLLSKRLALIKGDLQDYNPKSPTDAQLRDDFRITLAWGSLILKGKKLFKKIDEKKKEIAYQDIIGLGTKIVREMKERGFTFNRPETYKPNAKKVFKDIISKVGNVPFKEKAEQAFPPLDQIDPPYLKKLDDKQVISLYKHLHALFKEKNKIWEELHNANIFVGIELLKRKLYQENKIEDRLTKETELEILEYPTPKGFSETQIPTEFKEKGYITLEEILNYFPPQFEIRVPPSTLYLAGSLVNKKKIPIEWLDAESEHDIDLIHRGDWDRRIVEELISNLPSWLGRKIKYFADREGPIMGWSVPLYNKGFVGIPPSKRVILSPWEVTKIGLIAKTYLFRPFVPCKPRSGISKHEFFEVNDMWEKWAHKYIDKKIIIEKKYDGRRFQAHISKAGKKVKIITEDRMRDRANAIQPIAEEILSKLNAKEAILDLEMEAYDTRGKKVSSATLKTKGTLIPREDTAALTVGKVSDELMNSVVCQVYDVLFLDGESINDKSTLERIKIAHKIIPDGLKWWRAVPYSLANNKANFFSAIRKYRNIEGSEGVVAKDSTAIYPIKYKGENRHSDWAKLKNLKEIDVMVYSIIPKKETKTGRVMNIFMYGSAYLIPTQDKDKYYNSFERGGKWYAPIGRSYSTSTRCKIGDIITIMPIRIREYSKNGKRVFTWMFPYFKEKKPEKKEPDTITTVERIAKVGTKPLKQSILSLEECPFWNNETICPFRNKFKLPDEITEEESNAQLSRLKYPIKCKFAYLYKCKFTKDYYYEEEQGIDFNSIDYLELRQYNPLLARIILQKAVSKYMEYPPNNRPTPYVIQRHEIGDSQHFDIRFKANGYAIGWSVVGFSKDKPARLDYWKPAVGMRAETKARQPLEWLRVEGDIKAGEVGAGIEKAGKFTILSGTKKNKQARAIFGAQKVWFHEYFIKNGNHFKDWTRLIVRAIKVTKRDPVTKKPMKGKTEIMWRFMKPKDQTPYAILRGRRKKWKPPKGIIPFPLEWTKKKFPSNYEKWVEYMEGKKKESSLAGSRYSLIEHKWMGPVHKRGIPKREFHLLLDDGKERVMDFRSTISPAWEPDVAMILEGRISKKWMSYEGELRPMQHWNSNKKLVSEVSIIAKGNLVLDKDIQNKKIRYTLKIEKGLLRGKKSLIQEEKNSPFYKFSRYVKSGEEKV